MRGRLLAAWGLGLVLALGLGLLVWRLAPVGTRMCASSCRRHRSSSGPFCFLRSGIARARARRAPSHEPEPGGENTDWRSALAARRLAGPHQRYRLPLFVVVGPRAWASRSFWNARARSRCAGGSGRSLLVARLGSNLRGSGKRASGGRAPGGGAPALSPRCPLNGVILTVSPADLTLADALERREIADELAASLSALDTRLRARRRSMWFSPRSISPRLRRRLRHAGARRAPPALGFRLPAVLRDGAKSAEVVEAFHAGIRSLVESTRTPSWMLWRGWTIPARRAAHRLRGAGRGDGPDRGHGAAADPPSDVRRRKGAFLRGVYLTSSRQDPLTIDALLPELAARYAMPRSGTRPTSTWAMPSTVLRRRELRDAVIREAGLVGMVRPPWFRRPFRVSRSRCLAHRLLAWRGRAGADLSEGGRASGACGSAGGPIDAQALASRDAALGPIAAAADRLDRLGTGDVQGWLFRPFSIGRSKDAAWPRMSAPCAMRSRRISPPRWRPT